MRIFKCKKCGGLVDYSHDACGRPMFCCDDCNQCYCEDEAYKLESSDEEKNKKVKYVSGSEPEEDHRYRRKKFV